MKKSDTRTPYEIARKYWQMPGLTEISADIVKISKAYVQLHVILQWAKGNLTDDQAAKELWTDMATARKLRRKMGY